MDSKKITQIFSILQKLNPSPTTELNYESVFELLIAVILSAQSTDVRVNLVTQELFQIARTPQHILDLGLEQLKNAIKTIGLYNSKANNIFKTCQILVARYHSAVPDRREDLEQLPGVGRKTANVILNTAFHQPVIAVDTHLFRVCNRTKIAPGKNVLEVEQKLYQVIPKRYLYDAHHWLILHGRYICQARKPLCHQCPIVNLCEYEKKEL